MYVYLVVVVSVPIGFVPVVSTGVVATVSVVEGVVVVDGVLIVADESLLMEGEVDISEPVDFSGEWQAAANARNAIKTMLFI